MQQNILLCAKIQKRLRAIRALLFNTINKTTSSNIVRVKSLFLLFTILDNKFEILLARFIYYILILLSFLSKDLALEFIENNLFVKQLLYLTITF